MPAILTILTEDDLRSVAARTADAETIEMVRSAAASDARVTRWLHRTDESAEVRRGASGRQTAP